MQLPVDPAQRDLRGYQVARQLHMLPQLRDVFAANDMAFPMFYNCLDPRAKATARLVLLCLRRWLCARVGVNPAGAHPLLSMITEGILSYLSFPEFARPDELAPRSLYVQFGMQALTAAAAAAAAAATVGNSTATAAAEGAPAVSAAAEAPSEVRQLGADDAAITSPARSVAALAPASASSPEASAQDQPVSSPHEPVAGRAESSSTVQTPSRPSAANAAGASPTEQLVQVWERSLIYRPVFFVRPFVKAAGQASWGSAGDAGPHEFFIRMAHTGLLNEESLNPYFGRYGQVSCELLQRMPLTQCSYVNEEVAYSLTEMFHCQPQEVLIQDFIVSVDSAQNAERAVLRAYYRELLFIAFHERVESEYEARRRPSRLGNGSVPLPLPTATSNNCYAIADVDTMMAESAAVYRVLPAAAMAAAAAAATAAANAAAMAAAGVSGGGGFVSSAMERRRARREEERRLRQARRDRKRRRLGGSRDEAVAAVSDGESARSSSSSSSGSSSGSSSSGDAAARGALAGFVPHVVVDGFPYWMTEDQLKVLLVNYGTVKTLRLSVDDLSGAFTGAVLVHMSSVDEAVKVSEGLHGAVFKGVKLRAGVLNEKLEMESLVDGERREPLASDRTHADSFGGSGAQRFHVTVNERLWV